MVKVQIIHNQEVESQMTTPPVPEQVMVVELTTQKTQIRTKAQIQKMLMQETRMAAKAHLIPASRMIR